MVRFLLIRHAESVHNRYQATNVRPGPQDIDGLLKVLRGENSQEDGDVALTELGVAQAVRLADVWAPLIEKKARAGRLHVFVSPMRRALETADPLMRRLHAACGQTATVKPAIMEFAGLTAPSDMALFDRTDALRRRGDMEGAHSLLRSMRWRACGLTGEQLKQSFPWAELPADFPLATPWYTRGFEGPKRTSQRLDGVMKEISGYPSTYGNGDVVVFVSHGGTISDLLHRVLLNRARSAGVEESRLESIFDSIANTSVTSLLLPSAGFAFAPDLRSGGGVTAQFRVFLEFANNTTHLGVERLQQWAVDHGVKSKL